MELKFTDEQFLEGYNNGISDTAMAKMFGCSQQAVRVRRCKFKLISNFKPFFGEKKSPEELESYRKQNTNTNRIKRQREKYRIEEDWRENNLNKSKIHHTKNRERDNKRHRENYYKNQEREKERNLKYYYENREKRLKQMKEWYKKRKEGLK